MCDTDEKIEKKEKKTQFVAVSVHLCSLDLLDHANANMGSFPVFDTSRWVSLDQKRRQGSD